MYLVPCEVMLDPLAAVSWTGSMSMLFISWSDAG